MKATFDRLPLYFIENRGQLDPRVAYYVQGHDKTLYFTPEGVTFVLSDPTPRPPSLRGKGELHDPPLLAGEGTGVGATRWVVKLDFVGANHVRPIGQEKAEAIISYFKGRPDQWHTGIPTYHRILYRDLWPGIDLAFYGTAQHLKFEFIVHPGADPGRIRLAYRGAEVKLNAAGQLEVTTPLGGFTDDVPIAYEEIDGRRVDVAVAYRWGISDFGFQIGPSYDPTRPLVIDPAVLIYCGYIGGLGNDYGYGIAVDGAGRAYIVGWTDSSESEGFPVAVGPDLTYNGGYDAFVARVGEVHQIHLPLVLRNYRRP